MSLEDNFRVKFSDVYMKFMLDNFPQNIWDWMKTGRILPHIVTETVLKYPSLCKFKDNDVIFLNQNIIDDKYISPKQVMKLAVKMKCDPIYSVSKREDLPFEFFEPYFYLAQKKGEDYFDGILHIISGNVNFSDEFLKGFDNWNYEEYRSEYFLKYTEEQARKIIRENPDIILSEFFNPYLSIDFVLGELQNLYPRFKRKIDSGIMRVRPDMTSEHIFKYPNFRWDVEGLSRVLDFDFIKKHAIMGWDIFQLKNNPTVSYQDWLEICEKTEFLPSDFLENPNITFKDVIKIIKVDVTDQKLMDLFETSGPITLRSEFYLENCNEFTLQRKISLNTFCREYLIKSLIDVSF